ncbi:MAG: response regulator transcription factor [Bacteroidia bacterium]
MYNIAEPKTKKTMARIMIVDDHQVVADSLETHIESKKGHTVVHKAANGREAIDYLESIDPSDYPDVILMDLFMEDDENEFQADGFRTARYIFRNIGKKDVYEIRIIILSSSVDGLNIYTAHNMSIQGYLAKEAGSEEIFEAIDTVMKGEMYYRGKVYREMSRYIQSKKNLEEEIIPPSPMELEVLKLTAKGLTAKEVAATLSLTVDAAEAHKRQLFRKLNAKNVAEVISIAFRLGYLKIY